MIRLLISLILFPTLVLGMVIEEKLKDPMQEKIAQELFKNIRCVTCSGQSIADSDSGFSNDLRNFIRGELNNNKSKDEIEKYLVKKFGENIILTPIISVNNYLLWFFPLIFILVMFNFIYRNNIKKIF